MGASEIGLPILIELGSNFLWVSFVLELRLVLSEELTFERWVFVQVKVIVLDLVYEASINLTISVVLRGESRLELSLPLELPSSNIEATFKAPVVHWLSWSMSSNSSRSTS